MTVSRAENIEAGAGLAAAGALASAFGFAGYRAVFALLAVPGTVAVSAASALIGFMVGRRFLRLLEGEPKPFPQPAFNILDVEPIETEAIEVLELTEADRFVPAVVEEPLILDDVLAGVSPDSRVVRLFDRAAMPTPGQLQARIDRHLNGGTSQSPSPDASEALFEALADLRRSLR